MKNHCALPPCRFVPNACLRIALAVGLLAACLAPARRAAAAERLARYYAQPTREDAQGVLAPWHTGQNGQLDERLRIGIEAYKRYPWVSRPKAVMAAPDFIYNSHWSISPEGKINIPPTTDWMCGDLSQRAWSIIKGLTDYYRYSGDAIAFLYIRLTADYILDHGLTSDAYPGWPRFPIANPTQGKIYGKCSEQGRMQLDLCARLGSDFIRAHKLTGDPRYLEAARHWGELIAGHCNFDPKLPPWNRYANPETAGWSDELTGSTTMILEFLDDLLAMGISGKDGIIRRARDAGRAYLTNTLLPRWTANDTWGRTYWDWDNPTMCGGMFIMADYFQRERAAFPLWQTDLRNIMTLIFNRNGVDPNSHGEAYSGAWAFPESSTCCGTSLSYCQYTAAPTFIRFGALAGDPLMAEIGRRMMIMATYDSQENGVVKDGLFGDSVATGEWSNLAHPWPVCQILEAMAWRPETFGPQRENHIMRSGSVVNWVEYDKGRVEYSVYDAPAGGVDVLRLSFKPTLIVAGAQVLTERATLGQNGYTAAALPGGDTLVSIRHDGLTRLRVEGNDPQRVLLAAEAGFKGNWDSAPSPTALSGNLLSSAEPGAALSFKFFGNQIRLIGHVGPQGGWADVTLDGARQNTLLECWNAQALDRRQLYARGGMANTTHTLTVTARGDANPISTGKTVWIDAAQISDQTAKAEYGAGGGPCGAQRMIFGYTDRQDYKDSRGNLWRPGTEFVARTGYGTDSVQQALWTSRRSMYIGNTPDEEVYRYGLHGKEFRVNLTVGPGKYYVRLHMAATPPHWFLEKDKSGGRVKYIMNCELNGTLVFSNLDVEQAAGGLFKAAQKTYLDIEPRNGMIALRFSGAQEREACLQALEIGPMSELKK